MEYSTEILKNIFTEGFELIIHWDRESWNSERFLAQCWIYHEIEEEKATELERLAMEEGALALAVGSAFEMDCYSMLWSRKGFTTSVALENSWLQE